MIFVWLRGGNRVIDVYNCFRLDLDVKVVVWVLIDLKVVGDLIWVLDRDSLVN